MAVTSLISPSGIVSPRPTPPAIVTPTRPETEVAPTQPRPAPEVRELSRGIGPTEQRRIEILQNAERQRMQVEAEEAARSTRQAFNGLTNLRADLLELRSLIHRAQDMELQPEQRSDIEQQALEMASSIGEEVEVGATDGPEIASIPGVGFQPDTLGVVAVRDAGGEESDAFEIRDRVDNAISRVSEARDQVQERLETLSRPEESEQTTREEGIEVERDRITTEDDARQLIEDIRSLQVEQGNPLIINLTTLGAEAVAALIP